ncbi:hypothetical protein QL285_075782 [Trifolium repens]|nr:hypothetical protein QL285_075782 [Trifolium repens]
MENMQKQIDALRVDVDQVTDKLDRVLEILASLSLPSRVDVAAVGANPPIDSPLSKVVWPSYGSSSGYTSAVAQVTQESLGTNTEFMVGQPRTHQVLPRFAISQSLEEPKNAHQDDNFKGKSVVSPSEETRQRLKAIEDKLRIMESFLPNNVCPPHSHSAIPARVPYLNHQYPTVVQHQQPQGFPKQKIQMLLNHFQSGQSTQNSRQQQQSGYPPKSQYGPRKERRNVHYDRIPMPYGQILPHLLHKGLVQIKPIDPVSPPYPTGFDENARCDYHNGSPGHNIENCRGFKYKVQELIDQKLLTFKEGEPNCEGLFVVRSCRPICGC